MAASLGILVIRSSLVDWRSMKKSADMRGTSTYLHNFKNHITVTCKFQLLCKLWKKNRVADLVVSSDPVLIDRDVLRVQQLTARTILPCNT
jgi:hypothetical protein